MKLNGTYKYFKIVQLTKALFIPLILFSHPDYISPENSSGDMQFVDLANRIGHEKKIQLQSGINNFRVNGFNATKSRNSVEMLRTNHFLYNQTFFKQ